MTPSQNGCFVLKRQVCPVFDGTWCVQFIAPNNMSSNKRCTSRLTSNAAELVKSSLLYQTCPMRSYSPLGQWCRKTGPDWVWYRTLKAAIRRAKNWPTWLPAPPPSHSVCRPVFNQGRSAEAATAGFCPEELGWSAALQPDSGRRSAARRGDTAPRVVPRPPRRRPISLSGGFCLLRSRGGVTRLGQTLTKQVFV